jgi:hypothetical protein
MDAAMADADGNVSVTRASLAAMGRFLAAAENLEVMLQWAAAFADNNPEMKMGRLVEVSRAGGAAVEQGLTVGRLLCLG